MKKFSSVLLLMITIIIVSCDKKTPNEPIPTPPNPVKPNPPAPVVPKTEAIELELSTVES